MSIRDYKKAVFQATDLPDPEAVEDGIYHLIGEWEIHETAAAIDAVVARRLTLICSNPDLI